MVVGGVRFIFAKGRFCAHFQEFHTFFFCEEATELCAADIVIAVVIVVIIVLL
jgi:hypothetical protein